uniref:Uncharacterized protein n=1 Tax=Anopheles atroparvus TaxID=41427 RepID=A0AAG5D4N2_ANOAO
MVTLTRTPHCSPVSRLLKRAFVTGSQDDIEEHLATRSSLISARLCPSATHSSPGTTVRVTNDTKSSKIVLQRCNSVERGGNGCKKNQPEPQSRLQLCCVTRRDVVLDLFFFLLLLRTSCSPCQAKPRAFYSVSMW